MRGGIWIGAVVILVSLSTGVRGGTPALLEFQRDGDKYRGKLVAHDDVQCWLMGRDGQLIRLRFKEISQFRRVAPRFERFTAAELRDRLRREFGTKYEVAGTEHYLVCAARGTASRYSRTFEDLYRQFYIYFSTRGLPVSKPEFPLVAIVFPDQQSFRAYCEKDGYPASTGLRGYYLATSNRIALVATQGQSFSGRRPIQTSMLKVGHLFDGFGSQATAMVPMSAIRPIRSQRNGPAAITGDMKNLLIHEATHQMAYNTGLHSRIGQNPRWVVEGLATVFEAPGVRENARAQPPRTRINRDLYYRFRNFVAKRRKPRSLASFIGTDAMFQTNTLDAYSQAWALSLFLIETRPGRYSRYLKTMSARDPLQDYAPEQRLEDFKQSFGPDLDWIEVEFIRFVQRLTKR